MLIKDARVRHDFMNGILEGESVVSAKKYYKDAKGFYAKEDSKLSDDTIMYEVYTYAEGDMQQVGNLQWGLSILKSVSVAGECNMTRGHFHEDTTCAEFYFGLGGEGLLLLMDGDGVCHAERVYKNSLHHIDGTLAHRLINTGDTDLKVGACWPVKSGHDYKRVEEKPFNVRIYKENDKVITKAI